MCEICGKLKWLKMKIGQVKKNHLSMFITKGLHVGLKFLLTNLVER
jgi:hypothetical protein